MAEMTSRRVIPVTAVLIAVMCSAAVLAWWMPQPMANVAFDTIVAHGARSRTEPDDGDQAIVVLGGQPTRGPKAAAVSATSGLPLYVACCGLDLVLAESGAKPKWTESVSTNTESNAAYAACTLLPLGIRNIALVTDTYHLSRATIWFEAYGFRVTPIASPLQPLPEKARRDHARHELGGLVEVAVARLIPTAQSRPCKMSAR